MGRVRKLAVGCVAAGTVVTGIVLAWPLFRPGVLASVGTAQLVLLIGLFTLPLVALAAWEFERRARHAAPVPRSPEPDHANVPMLYVPIPEERAISEAESLPIVEPSLHVAQGLLEQAGSPIALPGEDHDEHVPRHRHPAHARRRAHEGVARE